MIGLWMVHAAAAAGVLACAALILERAFRWLGWPGRFLWLGALVVTLALTAAAVGPGDGGASRPGPVEPGDRTGAAAAMRIAVDGADGVSRGVLEVLLRFDRALLIGWACASGVALVLLFGSAWRMSRRRARWERGVIDGVPVRVTEGMGPAAVGALRSEIAVPRWVLLLDRSQRELVLRHEGEHVRARDPQLMLVALIVRALMPWNPGVVFLVRRLRAATEMDCDRRVLSAACVPAQYAALLIDIGARSTGERALSPAIVDGATDLERRVADILAVRGRAPGRRIAARIFFALLLLMGIAVMPRPHVSLAHTMGIEPSAIPAAPSVPARPPGTVTRVEIPMTGVRAGRGVGRGGGGARAGGRASAGGSSRSPLIDNDTIVTLIARHHPEIFREPVSGEVPVVALAFDATGRLLKTRRLGGFEPSVVSLTEALRRAFPELASRRPIAISRRIGEHSVDGLPPRTLVTYHGVYANE